MKRIFKILIPTAALLISASKTVWAEMDQGEQNMLTGSSTQSSEWSSEVSTRKQKIAQTKADADLYEVTLNEGRPILTELLRARIETYKKENNTDKATSDSVIIARILAQDAKSLITY